MNADEHDLLRWAESLAGIARTGLGFSQVPYERERYEEILHVAAEIRARADGLPAGTGAPDFATDWLSAVGAGVAGYVTPKVAVGAVVGDDDGRLLLIQRADSGIWLYPTGWADVGYSPAEVAVKEVAEETGIECEVIGTFAVFDGLRLGLSRLPLYSIVFHCRATGGELSPHPQECLDAGFYHRDEVPTPVANFDAWGDLAFAAVKGEPFTPFYDQPRNPVWGADA